MLDSNWQLLYVQNAGFPLQFDPVKVKFKPTAADMQIAEESGTDLAQAMLKALRKKTKQSGGGARASSGACPLCTLKP